MQLVLSCMLDALYFSTDAAFAYLIIIYWSSSREGLNSKLQCQAFRIKGVVLDFEVAFDHKTNDLKVASVSQSTVQPQTCS